MSGFGIGATWRWPVRRVRIRRNRDAVEADETFIGREEGAETPKGGYSHEHALLALSSAAAKRAQHGNVPEESAASADRRARRRRAGRHHQLGPQVAATAASARASRSRRSSGKRR